MSKARALHSKIGQNKPYIIATPLFGSLPKQNDHKFYDVFFPKGKSLLL